MKKAILMYFSVAMFCMISSQSEAQILPFTKGKSYITIGYGFPYTYSANFKTVETYTKALGGTYSSSSIGPFFLNYEYAIRSKFGIGLATSFATASYESNIGGAIASYDLKRLGAEFRSSWHPFKIKSWDPYLMGSIGYNVELGDEYIDPERFEGLQIPAAPDIIYHVALGIKYFKPQKGTGFYFEAGYGNTYLLQAGIAFRFGPDIEVTRSVW